MAPSERVTETVEKLIVHYMLSFKHLCLVTVSCPLMSLLVCLVTAFIFQPDDIHETHCRVYNVVPSISAITGISPQRYLWRISVAFHIGPRCIIAAVYRAYHLNLIDTAAPTEVQNKARLWLNAAFWLNITEIASLCGVTYISNRENYPIHEKLFIIFMVSSLSHMLACIKGVTNVAETRNDLESVREGLRLKRTLMMVSLISTVGLVGFFLEHRLLCHRMETVVISAVYPVVLMFIEGLQKIQFQNVRRKCLLLQCLLCRCPHLLQFLVVYVCTSLLIPLICFLVDYAVSLHSSKSLLLCFILFIIGRAFSGFAFCEYIIASANMAFHITVILDFPTEHLVVAKGIGSINLPVKNVKLE